MRTRLVLLGLVGALGCGGDDGAADGGDPRDAESILLTIDGDALVMPLEATMLVASVAPAGPNDGASLRWDVRSSTAELACDDVVELTQDGLNASLTIPAVGDARCRDELMVRATLTLADRTVTAEHRVEVTLPEGYGRTWTPDDDNPVLALDTCPTWSCLGHTDPAFYERPDGSTELWFSAGGDRSEFPVVGVGELVDGRVVSPRLVLFPDPDADPRPWDHARETVNVVRDGERALMTYLGYAISYFDDPSIGVAHSDDGATWERTAAPVYTPSRPDGWDASFISGPMALRGSDGRWRLYYGGASTRSLGGKIGVLLSDDGESWTPHPANPVFANRVGEWDESVIDAHVVFAGGRYLMWHTGWVEPLTQDSRISIGLAESEDGIEWTRVSNEPVLTPGETGTWNDTSVVSPSIRVEADGSLMMAVHGTSTVRPVPTSPEFRPERVGIFRSAP